MTKTELVKSAVTILVGLGTGKIVNDVIQNNTNCDSTLQTVEVTGAAVVIGMMAADATTDYTDRKIDELIHWYKTTVTK